MQELQKKLEAENVYLQEEIRQEHDFEEIVGNSKGLLDVLRRVATVAPTDSTVLFSVKEVVERNLVRWRLAPQFTFTSGRCLRLQPASLIFTLTPFAGE